MTSIDIVSLPQISPPFAFRLVPAGLPPFSGIWVDPLERKQRKRMTPPDKPERIDDAEELLIEIT